MNTGLSQNNSIKTILTPVAFAIGMMVSSDTLASLGTFLGNTGILGIGLLFLGLLVYSNIISQYRHLFHYYPHLSTENEIINSVMGTTPALFPFFIKLVTTAFVSTGLLVSAGFVFNEVFLYWFPNFGFAFILLGLLTIFQFLPEKTIDNIQILFAGIVLSGLLILIFTGLFTIGSGLPQNPEILKTSSAYSISQTVFIPLILFIGFDLGLSLKNSERQPTDTFIALIYTVLIMCVLFALWGVVSITFVPLEKLSITSIPHIIAAKKVLGGPGRLIMGTIVILGTLGCIHALFTNITRSVSLLLETKLIPKRAVKPKLILCLIALAIAGMMALGVAGEETLETFIRGSLILWLLSYFLVSLSYYITTHGQNVWHNIEVFKKVKHIFTPLILVAGSLTLVITDQNTVLLLKFMGITSAASIFSGLILSYMDGIIKKSDNSQ